MRDEAAAAEEEEAVSTKASGIREAKQERVMGTHGTETGKSRHGTAASTVRLRTGPLAADSRQGQREGPTGEHIGDRTAAEPVTRQLIVDRLPIPDPFVG